MYVSILLWGLLLARAFTAPPKDQLEEYEQAKQAYCTSDDVGSQKIDRMLNCFIDISAANKTVVKICEDEVFINAAEAKKAFCNLDDQQDFDKFNKCVVERMKEINPEFTPEKKHDKESMMSLFKCLIEALKDVDDDTDVDKVVVIESSTPADDGPDDVDESESN